ncbi:TPA: hypothetical protein ACMD15_003438 [Vibrio cholerae]
MNKKQKTAISSFQWYEPIDYKIASKSGVPLLDKGEFRIDGQPIQIHVMDNFMAEFCDFKIGVTLGGELVPFYEDGRLFITYGNQFATIKKGDLCYVGVKK